MGALNTLIDEDCEETIACLNEFEQRWKDDSLTIMTWLRVQAMSNKPGNLSRVKELMGHPSFSLKNPSSVRALITAFSRSLVNFHAADGSGYEWYTDMIIEVDKLNNITGARMADAFTSWRRLDEGR